jgi:single-stranded-DNA-specific exonuclease
MERLGELIARQGAAPAEGRSLAVAGLVAPGAATLELAEALAAAGPYGAGSPAPRLAVPEARVAGLRRVGEGHLAFTLTDGGGGRLEAIAFRAAESPLGALIAGAAGAPLHLAGRLERDDWGGRRRVKLHVEDAARPA